MRTYVIRVTSGERTGWYNWDWFTGESWIFWGGNLCAIINDAKRGSATECRYYLRSADSMSSILLHGGWKIIEVYAL